jgi:hypothetical protein
VNKSISSDDDSAVFDNTSLPVTGAGQELIDRYTDRQRLRLIREIERLKDVERSSSDRASVEEVSVAIARLEGAPALRVGVDGPSGLKQRIRFNFLSIVGRFRLSFVLLFAFLMSVTGLLVLIFSSIGPGSSDTLWSSLLAGVGTGFAAAALGMTISGYFSARRERVVAARRVATLDFARKVDSIETLARVVVSRKSEGVAINATLGEILASLVSSGIWSGRDVTDYRLLLRIRNSVVYQDKLLIATEELLRMIATADRLEDYLRENGSRAAVKPTVDNAN